MNFSFKKYLPKLMLDTRWGEFIEVWQSIYSDIKQDKVQKIFSQYVVESATRDDLLNLCSYLGYPVKYFDGYTSTDFFLKRQIETIVPRISYKTTQTGYVYAGVPYNLISTAYVVSYDQSNDEYFIDETLRGTIVSGVLYLDTDADNIAYYVYVGNLDSGTGSLDSTPLWMLDVKIPVYNPPVEQRLFTYLDDNGFPSLDGQDTIYTLTRNVIFSYVYKFVETADEFLSQNTLRVLQYDIEFLKRKTERIYYEPNLITNLNANLTLTTKNWTDYLGASMATQKSILIVDNMSNATKIRFGNSTYATVDNTIDDVANFLFELDSTQLDFLFKENSGLTVRSKMTEFNQFPAITEIAVWDALDNCILYTTFPAITWYPDMYNNIKLSFARM